MSNNLLQMLDFISPKITLFYDENKRYSTIIGGIFTIIICCVGIIALISQLFSFIHYDINSIQYYRKILNESDTYKINYDKESVFIYIDILTLPKISTDLSKIRMVGLFSNSINIREYLYFERGHWLFVIP